MHLSRDQKIRVTSLVVEGTSLRAASRLSGVARDTIGRLMVRLGGACWAAHDRTVTGLQVPVVELDEQWSFVHTKQKRLAAPDQERGDQWTYWGLCAATRLVVSYAVGKRTPATTRTFIADLRKRIDNSPVIYSDGYAPYIEAIHAEFGPLADYSQLVKMKANGRLDEIRKNVISGVPPVDSTCTSFVERLNGTSRQHMRRMTRRTYGFSKRLRNHAAATALFAFHYNFARPLETLRVSPAMEAGLMDHILSIGEIVDLLDDPDNERADSLPCTVLPSDAQRWTIIHEAGFDSRAEAVFGSAELASDETRLIIRDISCRETFEGFVVVFEEVDGVTYAASFTSSRFEGDELRILFKVDTGHRALHLLDVNRFRKPRKRVKRAKDRRAWGLSQKKWD